MKACSHFQLFGKETHIEPSELLWNGWITVYDGSQIYYQSFRAGLFLEYLHHLAESKKCRRQAGVTKKKVQQLLKRIEKEWKEVTN